MRALLLFLSRNPPSQLKGREVFAEKPLNFSVIPLCFWQRFRVASMPKIFPRSLSKIPVAVVFPVLNPI